MSEAYIIEIDDLAAGIVQRERRGFRFRAAHRDFFRLEDRVFETPWRAQQAAEDLLRGLTARRARHARPPVVAMPVAVVPAAAAAVPCWGLVAPAAVPGPATRRLDMPR